RRRGGRRRRAVLAARRVLDHRVHLCDEPPGLQLDGVLVHRGCHLGAPALQEAAARAAQAGEKPSRAQLRCRVARAGIDSVTARVESGGGSGCCAPSEVAATQSNMARQRIKWSSIVVGRSPGYNVTMTVPATSRQTRTFEDRADALAHFFL